MTYIRGDQIAYVPHHVRQRDEEEWLTHPDTEKGFVWEDEGDTVLCRYWSKYEKGVLRTRSNSERCNKEDLVYCISEEYSLIRHWIKVILEEKQTDIPKF